MRLGRCECQRRHTGPLSPSVHCFSWPCNFCTGVCHTSVELPQPFFDLAAALLRAAGAPRGSSWPSPCIAMVRDSRQYFNDIVRAETERRQRRVTCASMHAHSAKSGAPGARSRLRHKYLRVDAVQGHFGFYADICAVRLGWSCRRHQDLLTTHAQCSLDRWNQFICSRYGT